MKRRTVATGIAVLALATAACQGDDGKPAAGRSGLPAASQGGTVSLPPVTLPARPAALADLVARQVRAAGTLRAEVVNTLPDGGSVQQHLTAQVRTNTPTPTVLVKVVDSAGTRPETTHAVVLGGVFYVRTEGEEQEPGKPWARLSRRDIDAFKARVGDAPEAGQVVGLLETMYGQADRALREVTADTGLNLVRHGAFRGAPAAEDLTGTRVTRFEGTTRTAAVARLDRSFAEMDRAGLRQIAWTLWVDASGLPRKYTVTLATAQGRRVTSVATYSGWGGPVAIQAPPPAQVATLTG
ncbi:hypothetical protein DPM19_15835 [Actinomadura craniellae]|uniref:LppX_LprAFG lipoprotein n=1 Tax=Actinomadura craniellae TaxID=2231787 RepID=A0A365H5R1_9ACTN|nr:hypothetical protein [Actinomadura craniellae]RAY14427.1 hypothetical protein DPM19_15835 [Actinomadura craniellae]